LKREKNKGNNANNKIANNIDKTPPTLFGQALKIA